MRRFKIFIGIAIGIILVASVLLEVAGCGESELTVTTMKEGDASESQSETDRKAGADEATKTDEAKKSSGDINDSKSDLKEDDASESQNDSSKTDKQLNADEKTTICVYICGAVVNEGVYEVPAGSRVSEVLDKAGGYSEEALHGYVNLARTLEDGERVYIPDREELESLGILEGDGSSSNSQTDSNSSASDTNNARSDTNTSDSTVNINTADAETLKTLPGIGDKKAADIIAYREEHGNFSSTEDIKNVSGIGDSTFEKLSPHISVN